MTRPSRGLTPPEEVVLGLLAEYGPLRATSMPGAVSCETEDLSTEAAADDEDDTPWVSLTYVRKLIGRGLARYVRETDRYALTSAGYRALPPVE